MIKTLRNIHLDRSIWVGTAMLVVTIAIAIGWQVTTPPHSDDHYYRHWPSNTTDIDIESATWDIGNEPITSYSQVPGACINHWLTNNGRLSNIAYITVLPIPRPVIGVIIGLFISAIALLLLRIAGRLPRSLSNPWLVIAVPILLWTGFIWYNQFQSADFQFNYTIPSVMMLGLLMLFGNPERKPGPWGWALLCVFAPWHECFTIFFGVYLGVQWLFDRRRNTLIAIAILIVGVILTMSPGSVGRADRLDAIDVMYYPYTMALSSMWPALVALIWWAIRRRKLSPDARRSLDRMAAGLGAMIATAFVMLRSLGAPQRSHWAVELIGMVMIIKIIAGYNQPRHKMLWLTLPLLALYMAWGVSLINYQISTRDFSRYSIEQLRATDDDVIVDRDGFLERPMPFWLMNMTCPQYTQYERMGHNPLACEAKSQEYKSYIALPPDLYGKPFDAWPKVPGANDFRYASGGLLVRRHDSSNLKQQIITLTYGEPTLNTSPLDDAIAVVLGRAHKQQFDLRIAEQTAIAYRGDSLEVLMFETPPRTAQGRRIIAADMSNIKL